MTRLQAVARADLAYALILEWIGLIFGSMRAREEYLLAERLSIEHWEFPIYR